MGCGSSPDCPFRSHLVWPRWSGTSCSANLDSQLCLFKSHPLFWIERPLGGCGLPVLLLSTNYMATPPINLPTALPHSCHPAPYFYQLTQGCSLWSRPRPPLGPLLPACETAPLPAPLPPTRLFEVHSLFDGLVPVAPRA